MIDLLHIHAETGRVEQVGGWEYNTKTNSLIWTEETYPIHAVNHNYRPILRRGMRFYSPASLQIINRAIKRTRIR